MSNVDYTQKTPQQLRCCYRRFIVHGMPLPSGLLQALKTTFPVSFDAEKQIFTNSRKPKMPAIFDNPPQQFSPAPLYSVKTQRGKYKLTTHDGRTLLVGALEPYELVLFDRGTGNAVVRKHCEDNKHRIFIISCNNNEITDATRESGASDIAYVPGTHELLVYRDYYCMKNTARVYGQVNTVLKRVKAPDNARIINAKEAQSHTIIVNPDGAAYTTPLITLPDESQPIAPESTMILTQMSNTPAIQMTDADAQTSKNVLQVHLHPVQREINGTHYDVYVNGRRIVENNIDTQVQTFLDGTLLGVYGVPANHPSLPGRKLWQLFSTDLKPRLKLAIDEFSLQRSYITNVYPGMKQIRANSSDKIGYVLELKREYERAKGKKFEIIDPNQR